MKEVQEIGYIEKGTGKHQSNVVYGAGGGISDSDCKFGNQNKFDDRYSLCDDFSYCLDANYAKGTTVDGFFQKHRRQLIIEIK
jgi:hypothetical protein